MIEKRFGSWTILDGPFKALNGHKLYLCHCSCGITKLVYGNNLVNGTSRRCKKCRNKKLMVIFEQGELVGHWTIMGPPLRKKDRKWYYPCRCVCGKKRNVTSTTLNTGRSKCCQSCSKRLSLIKQRR